MYYPESILDMVINAPTAYPRNISKLTASLGHLFDQQHEISLEPLPENQIDKG